MAKKVKISTLDKKLWKIFSEYIRHRDTPDNGWGWCISCAKKVHYSDMDAGHFISRRFKSVKFDEHNVNGQCRFCNRYLNGNTDEYFVNLEAKYGREVIEDLIERKHDIFKQPVSWYEEKIEEYKKKISLSKKEIGDS